MPDGAQLTPQEFAAKIKAKYPAYASLGDDELVSKITAKYPQYKTKIKTPAPPPITQPPAPQQTGTERAMVPSMGGPPMFMDVPKGDKAKAEAAGQEGYQRGGKVGMEMVGSAAGGEEFAGGKGILGALMRMFGSSAGAAAGNVAGQAVTSGKVDPRESEKTGASYAAAEGVGEVVGGVVGAFGKQGEELARINKSLGVGSKEVRVGATPASLDEFAGNPARGALKYGLDEKTLSKMSPLEKNIAISKAKNEVGQQLESTLKSAQGTVNLQKDIDETFKGITDKKLLKQAEMRLTQILQKNNITKPLSQLTPYEARLVQRGLDDFANFSSGDAAKTFGDVASSLRRKISAVTRKAVPESAPLDQDYTDLVLANQATRKAASKYARTAPENQLRKWVKRAAVTGALGAAGGAGYEAAKHSGSVVP